METKKLDATTTNLEAVLEEKNSSFPFFKLHRAMQNQKTDTNPNKSTSKKNNA
jgi:hypothetical protein